MKRVIATLAVLGLAASSAFAAPGGAEDAQKVAAMQALLTAGEYDKALEQANAYLRAARDENAKTEAMRIAAEALRKKGDFKQAAAAYLRLRERFRKGSDDYVRYDAIAEVLKASPTGVYQPPGAPPAKSAPGAAATLADDGALADALTRLAGYRSAKLKPRISVILRGTTPQQVWSALEPACEEARDIFTLSADAPPDASREVCAAAAGRLQALGTQIIAALKAKIEKYQAKMSRPWSFTNVEKEDIKKTQAACTEMAATEVKFQEAIAVMGGKRDWPEAERFRKESDERRAAYEQLARQYVVPTYYYGGAWGAGW